MMFEPGEIYWADLPEATRHPVVILSRSSLNLGSDLVVAMLTSSRFEERRDLPSCVPLAAGTAGLPKNCVIHAQAIFTVRKSSLDQDAGALGRLDDERIREVIRAVGYVLDADCEPT